MFFHQDYRDFIFFVIAGVVGASIVMNSDKILALRPVRGHRPPRARPKNNKLRTSDPSVINRDELYKR